MMTEEMERTRGMYDALDTDLEIRNADSLLLQKGCRFHHDSFGQDRNCRRTAEQRDTKYFGLTAQDADLCILIWQTVRRVHSEGTVLEVEHVMARRSNKE